MQICNTQAAIIYSLHDRHHNSKSWILLFFIKSLADRSGLCQEKRDFFRAEIPLPKEICPAQNKLSVGESRHSGQAQRDPESRVFG